MTSLSERPPLAALIITDDKLAPKVTEISTLLYTKLGWNPIYPDVSMLTSDGFGRAWTAGVILTNVALADVVLIDNACRDTLLTGPIRAAVDMVAAQGITKCRGFDWYFINAQLAGSDTSYLNSVVTSQLNMKTSVM